MLSQEAYQLGTGPVYGHVLGVNLLLPQHVLKEHPATAASLPGLVHVEVQDAHGGHLVLLPQSVQQEQVLPAHFEQSHHTAPALVAGPVHEDVDHVAVLHVPDLVGAGDGGFEVLGLGTGLAHGINDLHDPLLDQTEVFVAKWAVRGQATAGQHVRSDPVHAIDEDLVEVEVEIHGDASPPGLLFIFLFEVVDSCSVHAL